MADLIRDGVIVADDWVTVRLPAREEQVRKQAGKVVLFKLTGEITATPEQIAETAIPPQGKIIVPLPVWLARRGALESRLQAGEIGVWLATHEIPETLAGSLDDLNQLPVIAVLIERFADGRANSIGMMLRTRYGFHNELRASGDVLRDQLFYLERCGYNSFDVRADRPARTALIGLRDFSEPYQGGAQDALPIWRRLTRTGPGIASRMAPAISEDEVD